MKFLTETIQLIRDKKELQGLDEHIVKEKLEKWLKKNEKQSKKIIEATEYAKDFDMLRKNREFKMFTKKVRTHLREIYGVFIEEGYTKKEKLLEELQKDPSGNEYEKLLSLHKSSKERLPFYDEVYQKIFEITGQPKSIVDLACGLNPLSYYKLGCEPTYTASDLNQHDCDFLNSFFKAMKIFGTAIAIDLTKKEQWEKIPKADVCFLFKALDSLEAVQRNLSKGLLDMLECNWIVVSFPKASLGQKRQIKTNKRNWLITFIVKQGWKLEQFEVENELFFVVNKKL